jgi:hypothetical protein
MSPYAATLQAALKDPDLVKRFHEITTAPMSQDRANRKLPKPPWWARSIGGRPSSTRRRIKVWV